MRVNNRRTHALSCTPACGRICVFRPFSPEMATMTTIMSRSMWINRGREALWCWSVSAFHQLPRSARSSMMRTRIHVRENDPCACTCVVLCAAFNGPAASHKSSSTRVQTRERHNVYTWNRTTCDRFKRNSRSSTIFSVTLSLPKSRIDRSGQGGRRVPSRSREINSGDLKKRTNYPSYHADF